MSIFELSIYSPTIEETWKDSGIRRLKLDGALMPTGAKCLRRWFTRSRSTWRNNILFTVTRFEMPPTRVKPRPSQGAFGDFAPKLAELTDDVLYGDVWERSELSKRDRSLVTVAALIALNRPDQLRSHLVRARENGVTQEELIETITHLAFYAGWPNAVNAINVAKEVFEKK